MEQLETIKGKSIVVPRLVNRYFVMYYDINIGWMQDYGVYTTPESALQPFIERQNKHTNINIKYYKVIEVELEIPFVPKQPT